MRFCSEYTISLKKQKRTFGQWSKTNKKFGSNFVTKTFFFSLGHGTLSNPNIPKMEERTISESPQNRLKTRTIFPQDHCQFYEFMRLEIFPFSRSRKVKKSLAKVSNAKMIKSQLTKCRSSVKVKKFYDFQQKWEWLLIIFLSKIPRDDDSFFHSLSCGWSIIFGRESPKIQVSESSFSYIQAQ